jgi:hypothetical protein
MKVICAKNSFVPSPFARFYKAWLLHASLDKAKGRAGIKDAGTPRHKGAI